MNNNSRVKRRTEAHSSAAKRATTPDEDRHNEFSMTRYDMLASAEAFHEPLNGLQTREVLSVDVFRHYFGGLAAPQ
jgi:hypothetical protein